MPTQPPRAAIYARLSSDRDEDKLGIPSQLADCRRLAADKGWEVVGEYVDPSTSAAKKNAVRPGYNRLVDDFATGAFDVLLCYDLDRLTRQPRQLEDWIDAAEDKGLRIVTSNGEADLATDNGRTFARIKAVVGKAEAEAASRRQKRNVQARREAGRFHGGNVPYGYRVEDGKLVIAGPEAELVRQAARRLLAGDSLYGICKDWNEREVRTGRTGTKPVSTGAEPSQHWRQGNLRSKLLNRAVLGEVKGGKVAWESVLDAATFEKVDHLLRDPSRNVAHSPGVRSAKYAMSGGLTVCSCGKRMVSQVHRGRTVLFCSKAVHGPDACGRNRIDHDELEAYVLDGIVGFLQDNPRWLHQRSHRDPTEDGRLTTLQAERDDLQVQQTRAVDLLVRGRLSESAYDAQLRRIEAEREDLDKQISRIVGSSIASGFAEGGLDWRLWSPARRRNFVRIAYRQITITPARIVTPRRRVGDGETVEEFEQRQEATVRTAMQERVQMVA